MKTKTVLLLAIMLGLFTYCLPLYAGSNKEYHVEERTVIKIPIVGKISTLTSSHLSGCKLKETTSFKMHNTLIKMMSDSDGKSQEVQLSNLCEELQWSYDDETETYQARSFEDIRQDKASYEEDNESQIDMESDQNDIDDLPRMSRKIMGYEKNINGFKAQKVRTLVYREEAENPIIIEEFYAVSVKPLKKVTDARDKLARELGKGDDAVEGVPSFIEAVYDSIREDEELERPEGDIVRFVISLLDDDNDSIFTMKYDVILAETIDYQADHFALR